MSDLAISVENLGKLYHIGTRQERYKTLRDSLVNALVDPIRRFGKSKGGDRNQDTIWDLKDVSFEVKQGEVVGIIGRNGAGKSTLLKILSHITEPTEGRVRLRGRVGSLLEVGTGFHTELTGRENIYLNGAILGMKKAEIERKFDEIVAFAEIEKFLDTPVKRYSSGMYVRLAFAVAAHLEPEILVVDEVLAVGDVEFQKKCLGKMGNVARQGRTVLFVSHNMASIRMLCSAAILLENGSIKMSGSPDAVIGGYLSASHDAVLVREWSEAIGPGDRYFRLLRLEILQNGNLATEHVSTGTPLEVRVKFLVEQTAAHLQVGLELGTIDGIPLFQSFHSDGVETLTLERGVHCLSCVIPAEILNEGMYVIRPLAALYFTRWILNSDLSIELRFQATLDHPRSQLWYSARSGAMAPYLMWKRVLTKASPA
jgi:lipopolysaccharide transport system ATP-binding protein